MVDGAGASASTQHLDTLIVECIVKHEKEKKPGTHVQALFSAAFCCFSALSLNLLEQADAVLADDFRAAEELACQEAMPVAEVSRLTEADWHAGDRI